MLHAAILCVLWSDLLTSLMHVSLCVVPRSAAFLLYHLWSV